MDKYENHMRIFYESVRFPRNFSHNFVKRPWSEVRKFLMSMGYNNKVCLFAPRRCGKTLQSLLYVTYYASNNDAKLIRFSGYTASYTVDIMKRFLLISEFNNWDVKKSNYVVGKSSYRSLLFPNNTRIIFCSDSLQFPEEVSFDLVILDEFSLYKNLRIPACSKLIMITTPCAGFSESNVIKSGITSNIFL